MKENLIIYHCEECREEFEAEQGSRRRFCDKCLAKRVSKKTAKGG